MIQIAYLSDTALWSIEEICRRFAGLSHRFHNLSITLKTAEHVNVERRVYTMPTAKKEQTRLLGSYSSKPFQIKHWKGFLLGPEAGLFAQEYTHSFDFFDKKKPIIFVRLTKWRPSETKIFDVLEPATKMIAALARQRHPKIFAGAVASSTPFKITPIDVKYWPHVAKDFSNPHLGGSPACVDVLTEAHQEYAQALKKVKGRRAVEEKFRYCDRYLEDVNNQIFSAIGGRLLGMSPQYNDPHRATDYHNIEKICGRLTNGRQGRALSAEVSKLLGYLFSESSLDKLADIRNTNEPIPPGRCRGAPFRAFINLLRDSMSRDPDRLDLFHTCDSQGLFGSCDGSRTCPFYTKTNWVDFYLMVCKEGFGVSKDQFLRNVKDLQEYVGEDLHGANNILLINGDADPWYPSGITKGRPGLQVINVPDASHCFWCNMQNE
ncbi:Thymus-specific serine protease [Perkinsus chesapeaki]|uniref:Thymus-specific serine protease n=1 Tax=Perkinsus chesapeaki TaxID=330153 RepID=A0A7J6LQ49_PERCH|nr:Thymus-specific serine protease [Perkinsus chesapeaki]